MKRISVILIIVIKIISLLNIPTEAYDVFTDAVVLSDGSKVFYFEDGSSLTVSVPEITHIASNSPSRSSTIHSSIYAEHKDSSGNTEWKYTLYATFSYEYGVSSVCTNAYYDQTIYKGNWTFSNGATSISGNRGSGTGHYEEKFLFITLHNIDVQLTMACDIYGNVTA